MTETTGTGAGSSEGGAAPPPALGNIDAGKESRAAQGLPIIPALDGFRALAIFAIVFLHLIGVFVQPHSDLPVILTFGPLPNAVDILFILSGFVVFLPTVARDGDFGPAIPYAIRRAARLLPAFWLAIAIVVLMLAVWPTNPGPPIPGLGAVAGHITGLQTPIHLFDSGFPLGLGIDGPLWTLSIEITFYLLLPFVAALFYRHPIAGLASAIAITVLWKLGAAHLDQVSDLLGLAPSRDRLAYTETAAYSQFPAFAAQFGMGMAAAWLYVKLPQRLDSQLLASRAVWVQAAGLIAFLALSVLFGRFALDGSPLAPTKARQEILLTLAIPVSLSAFMLATAFVPRRLQMPFALPAARSLGDISYGVYLIHLPLILLYGTLVLKLPDGASDVLTSFWVAAPLLLALTIGYGYLSGRYLEQPIRRWAHRFGRRARTPAPGPSREQLPVPGSR